MPPDPAPNIASDVGDADDDTRKPLRNLIEAHRLYLRRRRGRRRYKGAVASNSMRWDLGPPQPTTQPE